MAPSRQQCLAGSRCQNRRGRHRARSPRPEISRSNFLVVYLLPFLIPPRPGWVTRLSDELLTSVRNLLQRSQEPVFQTETKSVQLRSHHQGTDPVHRPVFPWRPCRERSSRVARARVDESPAARRIRSWETHQKLDCARRLRPPDACSDSCSSRTWRCRLESQASGWARYPVAFHSLHNVVAQLETQQPQRRAGKLTEPQLAFACCERSQRLPTAAAFTLLLFFHLAFSRLVGNAMKDHEFHSDDDFKD